MSVSHCLRPTSNQAPHALLCPLPPQHPNNSLCLGHTAAPLGEEVWPHIGRVPSLGLVGLPAGTLSGASRVASPSPEFSEGSLCIRNVGKGKGSAQQAVMSVNPAHEVGADHTLVISALGSGGSPQLPTDLVSESPLA